MGCVQENLNPGSNSQAQTEALGGREKGDHRRYEETMGAERAEAAKGLAKKPAK
jgi:hypothetical protein